MTETTTEINPRALHLIRGGLVISPLVFDAIVLFLLPESAQPTIDESAGALLSNVFLIMTAAAAATLLAVRTLGRRAQGFSRKAALCIVGWAVGEGIALLGGVIGLLTTQNLPLLVGLAMLAVSIMMFPIPEPEPTR